MGERMPARRSIPEKKEGKDEVTRRFVRQFIHNPRYFPEKSTCKNMTIEQAIIFELWREMVKFKMINAIPSTMVDAYPRYLPDPETTMNDKIIKRIEEQKTKHDLDKNQRLVMRIKSTQFEDSDRESIAAWWTEVDAKKAANAQQKAHAAANPSETVLEKRLTFKEYFDSRRDVAEFVAKNLLNGVRYETLYDLLKKQYPGIEEDRTQPQLVNALKTFNHAREAGPAAFIIRYLSDEVRGSRSDKVILTEFRKLKRNQDAGMSARALKEHKADAQVKEAITAALPNLQRITDIDVEKFADDCIIQALAKNNGIYNCTIGSETVTVSIGKKGLCVILLPKEITDISAIPIRANALIGILSKKIENLPEMSRARTGLVLEFRGRRIAVCPYGGNL